MRDIQKKMFICSSHCCEDNSISREEVETCIDRCNASMKKIQNVIEKELTAFQVIFFYLKLYYFSNIFYIFYYSLIILILSIVNSYKIISK